jgi:hypothetical protein
MGIHAIGHVQVAAPRGCEAQARYDVRWDDPVAGRFFTADPFANRLEVLA